MRPHVILQVAELRKHERSMASYMRPLHYVILESGTMRMNRTAKVEVAKLRERGRWDG